MIRTIAFGVICLAGLGAIAVGAKRPALAPEPQLVFPAPTGKKSNRLQIAENERPTSMDNVKGSHTPSAEQQPAVPTRSIEPRKPPPPDFTRRHWHDPYDAKAGKLKTSDTRQAKKRSPAGTPIRLPKQEAVVQMG